MGELPGQLLIQAVLIFVNAFFAATEIAVLSLNTAKLKKQREEGDRMAGKLLRMAEEPSDFLSTIQVGITLAGFLGSAFAAENFSAGLTRLLYDDLGVTAVPRPVISTLSLVLITIALSYFTLIFGELVPKRIAMQKPDQVARIACGPVSLIARIMRPVINFLAFSTNLTLRMLHLKTEAEEEAVTEDEIRLMIDLGKENGAIGEEEKEWLQNVFDFGDTTAEEVMTREFEIESLRITDGEEEIFRKIRETGLSRFPVYDEKNQDILGILYAREYLLNRGDGGKKSLRELLHPAWFVPESIHTDLLFQELQKRKLHMAIVVGEYGNINGIVTMEDLLEEIVGNIYDEFDPEEDPEPERIENGQWRFPGSTPVEEAAKCMGVRLPESEDYDTLGGLMLDRLGTVPGDGTTVEVELDGICLQAEKIRNRRIESVLIRLAEKSSASAEKKNENSDNLEYNYHWQK